MEWDHLLSKGSFFNVTYFNVISGKFHRIDKELQLLDPSLFEKIFLGLGGFHMEKKSCYGSYLQECGIGSVFAENEIFGPGVV